MSVKKGVNKITIKGDLLIKESSRSMSSEIHWYKFYNIGKPRIDSAYKCKIIMEYIKDYKSITDLLHEGHRFDGQLFVDIDNYIEHLGLNYIRDSYGYGHQTLDQLLNDKYEERNIQLGDLSEMINKLNTEHLSCYECNMLPHNDLHFGNILYKDHDIITVDPSLYYNNIMYDYAKLFHSFFYDAIIRPVENDYIQDSYEILFRDFLKFLNKKDINLGHILLITANLFFTMIPLHEQKNRDAMEYVGITLLKYSLNII
jgi:streptomycin 6-kinase